MGWPVLLSVSRRSSGRIALSGCSAWVSPGMSVPVAKRTWPDSSSPDTARQSPRLPASSRSGVPGGGAGRSQRCVTVALRLSKTQIRVESGRTRQAWRPSPRSWLPGGSRAGLAMPGTAPLLRPVPPLPLLERASSVAAARSAWGCSRRLASSSVCGWPWRSCQSMRLLTDASRCSALASMRRCSRIGEAPPSRTAGGAAAADPARSVSRSSAARRTASACWRLRSAPRRSPPCSRSSDRLPRPSSSSATSTSISARPCGRIRGMCVLIGVAGRTSCPAPSAARRAAASAARAMCGHGAGRPRRRCGPRPG